MKAVLEQLFRDKLVVIARGIPQDVLVNASLAMHGAGVNFIESTFDHRLDDPIADNIAKIRALRGIPGLHVGAGTVLSAEEANAAFDAGCEYIISPCVDAEVIAETKRLSMLSIPGAQTATEIVRAWKLGADIVKLFPADDMGMHCIQNLRGPLPHIPFLVTGGVNPATIPEFLRLGVRGFGTGITILRPDLVSVRDYEGIATLARMHLDAIRLFA